MKFKIEPHELNKTIYIHRKGEPTKDEDGLLTYEEYELCKARAKVTNIRGSEYILASGDTVETTKKIYIRYKRNVEITEDDILIYKKNKYNITYVNNIDEANVWLEILVKLVK